MKTKAGFSLVELMVAVAIMAILAGIAAPSFVSMIAQSRATSQTNDLIGAVQFARSEAIKRNQAVTVCRAASSEASVCASGSTWEHWIVVNSVGTVLRRASVPGGGTLKLSSTLTNASVSFGGSGLANIGVGADSLVICTPSGEDNIITITIGVAGRTNLVKSSGGC